MLEHLLMMKTSGIKLNAADERRVQAHYAEQARLQAKQHEREMEEYRADLREREQRRAAREEYDAPQQRSTTDEVLGVAAKFGLGYLIGRNL
jgi:hypothetical protein